MFSTWAEFEADARRRHPERWGTSRMPAFESKAPVVNPAVPVEAKPGFVATEAIQSAPPERPGRSEDVKPPALADRGRLKDGLDMEAPDWKLRASGESDEGPDLDGIEPNEEPGEGENERR